MRQHSRQNGFTLVELTIVVVILGILAAIVIPRFAGASSEARDAVVASNLTRLRNSLELYRVQHHDSYPSAKKLAQLTGQTDAFGNAGTQYGPYMAELPVNPINDSNKVRVRNKMPNAPKGKQGWIFATTTGEIRANVTGVNTEGVQYFDL